MKRSCIRICCKIKLIKLFNELKESGDLAGCINDFFLSINNECGTSFSSSGITIGDFLGDMDLPNLDYQKMSFIYDMLDNCFS